MNTVIVTRHPALVTFLAEQGIEGKVISHASKEAIEGCHVYGVLPLHLAANAYTVTTPTLDIPAEMRGRELSLEQVREYFQGMETYVVRTKDDWNERIGDENLGGSVGHAPEYI